MSTIDPTVTPTRYEVSCLPPDHRQYGRSIVVVANRGAAADANPRVWSVDLDGWVYDCDGAFSTDRQPSERTPEWIERYRHDLDTALRIAGLVARTVADDLTRGGAR